MNRRNFVKIICGLPFLTLLGLKLPKPKIKIVEIVTHDEGVFVCEAKGEYVKDFIRNYRKKNEQRLKVAGYKTLIPELRIKKMAKEEYYKSNCVTTASALYFNGITI